MRHQRAGKKLGRDAAHRKALYSNLTGALIEHGRIKTTVTKAKAVKPVAEQMITLARRGDLHARRQAVAFLRSKDVVHKLFTEVGPRFKDRPGGYSRIVKIGPRPGDAAEMAYLELVEAEVVPRQRRERPATEPAAAAAVPSAAAEEPPATEEELVEDPTEPDGGAADGAAVAEAEPAAEDEVEPAVEDEAAPTGEDEAAPPGDQPQA
jgi:large subunit ribosomal protein L17